MNWWWYLLIGLGILIVIFIVAKKTDKSNNFIFGRRLAERMARVKQRTQYESALLGFTFVLISLFVSMGYHAFFSDSNIFWRIFYGLNSFFGVLIVSSFLITQFQQYRTYLETERIKEEFDKDMIKLEDNTNVLEQKA